MIKLEYEKEYVITSIADLDKYKFPKKSIKKEIKREIQKYLNNDKYSEVGINLIGSEYNKNKLQEEYNKSHEYQQIQMKLLENEYEKHKITDDEFKKKRLDIINTFNMSKENLKTTLYEYDIYYKNHGCYDVVSIYVYTKEDE